MLGVSFNAWPTSSRIFSLSAPMIFALPEANLICFLISIFSLVTTTIEYFFGQPFSSFTPN